MTLTEFLLARIADDEAEAADAREDDPETVAAGFYGDLNSAWIHWRHLRTLAECEAKRRIVERCGEVGYGLPSTHLAHGILAEIALPYADHPDYRDEWRP